MQPSFCFITPPALRRCPTFPLEDSGQVNRVKDLPLRSSVSDCLVQKRVLQQPGGPRRLPWRQATQAVSTHPVVPGDGAVTYNHFLVSHRLGLRAEATVPALAQPLISSGVWDTVPLVVPLK